ncbi:MAG: hypothetical protein UY18_C0043G0005 [Microgenomates group bacterium GW2011_GWF2_47_9]|nr:MAG: hypothetical protein UY18_C0043G0005 [Microgenomates group bacterium GW2011_GWF2_47_9]
MANIDTISQDIKDLTTIVSEFLVPTVTKLQEEIVSLKSDVKGISVRVYQIDKKLDIVAKAVTVDQKKTDSRLRVLESKAGVFHD